MTLFLKYARIALSKTRRKNMISQKMKMYQDHGTTQYCAICGHEFCTIEEEHAKVGMDYLCETCASNSNKLLEWIGGIWCE